MAAAGPLLSVRCPRLAPPRPPGRARRPPLPRFRRDRAGAVHPAVGGLGGDLPGDRRGRAGAGDGGRGRAGPRRGHPGSGASAADAAVRARAGRESARLVSGRRRAPHRQRPRSALGVVRQHGTALPRRPPDPPRPLRHRLALPAAHGAGDGRGSRRCRCSARWATWRRRRPLCLSPGTDSAAVPGARLGAVPPGAGEPPGGARPRGDERQRAAQGRRQNPSPWVVDVRGVYDRAATHNLLLCSSLLLLFGDTPPPACRREAGARRQPRGDRAPRHPRMP